LLSHYNPLRSQPWFYFRRTSHLTFSDQITSLSKSCYYHIRQLRCIRPYLDFKTASTIATSIVHSKLDYCNSVITFQTVNLTGSKQIQNSLDRAVVKASKSTHITPILKSLHWLKVNERIEYKLLSLSLTKFLQLLNLAIFTTLSLFNLIAVPAPHSVVTLSRPPTIFLKMTDRSFRYASPRLWNQLPDSFRQHHHSRLDLPPHPLFNSSRSSSPLSSSITLSNQAQNLPFQQILPTVDLFYLLDCLTITRLDRTYHAHHFIFSFTF